MTRKKVTLLEDLCFLPELDHEYGCALVNLVSLLEPDWVAASPRGAAAADAALAAIQDGREPRRKLALDAALHLAAAGHAAEAGYLYRVHFLSFCFLDRLVRSSVTAARLRRNSAKGSDSLSKKARLFHQRVFACLTKDFPDMDTRSDNALAKSIALKLRVRSDKERTIRRIVSKERRARAGAQQMQKAFADLSGDATTKAS